MFLAGHMDFVRKELEKTDYLMGHKECLIPILRVNGLCKIAVFKMPRSEDNPH